MIKTNTNLRSCLGGVAVAVGALFLLLASSEPFPLTWDEGVYFDRAESILSWFSDPAPLEKDSIVHYWKFTTQNEGHPAGFAVVIAAGKRFSELFLPFLSEKTAWRFGPILLVSFALGAVYRRLEREYSTIAAIFSVLAILSMPRIFAHVHIAACESVLIGAWLLVWAFYGSALKSKFGAIACGCALGLTFAAKFTGLIALFPFLIGTVFLWKSFRESYSILLVLPVAGLVFFLLNPPLWFEPIEGLRTFLYLNTHREAHNISILFLGRMYDLDHPLPWYNTIVWTGITLPFGLLFLAFLGCHFGIRKRTEISSAPTKTFRQRAIAVIFGRKPDPHGTVILLNAVILLIVRAIPGTPPHDGVRMFAPAFAFIGILSGLGAERLWYSGRKFFSPQRMLVIAIYMFSVFNLVCFAPQWLSYYNILIGGLPGAKRAGMEPTYYWDALDSEVLDWINRNTPEGSKVRFSPISPRVLQRYRNWEELDRDFSSDAPGEYRWYVLQRRPSGEMQVDVRLINTAEPVFTKHIDACPVLPQIGPWNFEKVPLIEIYEYEDYERARDFR